MGSTAKFIIEEDRKKSRRKLIFYLRLGIGTVILLLLCKFVAIPFFEAGGGNVDTREVPGDATHFDPIASFDALKAYAGEGASLTSFDAYYVRSDGTMDLTADYHARVDLSFVVPTTAPDNAPPIGAGGSTTGKWYIPVDIDISQPGQWWHVTSGSSEYSYMTKGMERDADDPTSSDQTLLPDPTCPFATLWQEAIKHDAPQSAVAIIRYDAGGYDFTISGVSVYLEFDANCKLQSD